MRKSSYELSLDRLDERDSCIGGGVPGQVRRVLMRAIMAENGAVIARVVLLAGPSGAGKSHLAEVVGLPVVRLDDFYRDGDDDAMPRSSLGIVDWDDPGSWDAARAVTALERLCTLASADMPIYDIAVDATVGHRVVSTDGRPLVIAEGIFADQLTSELKSRGLLAAAICVRHHRLVTFIRRFQRDLREHRKPPLTLLRRGLRLLQDDPRVVRRCIDAGCEPLPPKAARRRIADLLATAQNA